MSQTVERASLIHQAVDLMIRSVRMHHRNIDKLFGDTGLHRSQRKILIHLSRTGEIPSQRDIASHFDISPACVARMLKSLTGEGYITREGDTDDLRRNQVRITEKGLNIVSETTRAFDRFDQQIFDGLSDEEIAELIRLTQHVQQNLQRCEASAAEKTTNDKMKGSAST